MGKHILTASILFFYAMTAKCTVRCNEAGRKKYKRLYNRFWCIYQICNFLFRKGSDVTLEIGANIFILNDGYDGDGTIMCPLKAGYRYTLNETGKGFYIEPQIGFNLVGVTSLHDAQAAISRT